MPDDTIKVWHLTRALDVTSILELGLEPRIGPRSMEAGETVPKIYVFPDSISMVDAITNWLGDYFEEEQASVLEISVPPDWVIQHDFQWEAHIAQVVQPEAIRVLIPDLDLWDGLHPDSNPPAGWFPADDEAEATELAI